MDIMKDKYFFYKDTILKPCDCGYQPKAEYEILGKYFKFGSKDDGFFAKCPICGKTTKYFFKNRMRYKPQTTREIIDLVLDEWNDINALN